MKLDLYTQDGSKKGTTDASDILFKSPVNEELVRLALLRQMANARQANAHTKTRGEVRGGGRKPWRQKGTGRARFGSSRNPIWRGGGIVFGPRNNRNYKRRMNQRDRQAALYSLLSAKAAEKNVIALEKFEADQPKTKLFAQMLSKLPEHRSMLVVIDEKNKVLEKSANNLPNVKTILVNYLNPHDLMKYEKVMFLKPSLKKAEQLFTNTHQDA